MSSVLADRQSLMRTKDQHPEGDELAQPWQRTSVMEGGHLYKPLGREVERTARARRTRRTAADEPDKLLHGTAGCLRRTMEGPVS